jgi:predicted ArsR family transcriptional regulator
VNPRLQKPIWEQIVDLVAEHPNGLSRADVAADFDITKNTALVHLEKAVSRGKLAKTYTWVRKNSRGWIYFHPSTRPDDGMK